MEEPPVTGIKMVRQGVHFHLFESREAVRNPDTDTLCGKTLVQHSDRRIKDFDTLVLDERVYNWFNDLCKGCRAELKQMPVYEETLKPLLKELYLGE